MNTYMKEDFYLNNFPSNFDCCLSVFWHLMLLRNGKPRRDPKTRQNPGDAREEAQILSKCWLFSVIRSEKWVFNEADNAET